ncbi:uncharacterized protein si:ch211-161h7.5 [Esox lucius]|uniref:uncharacterized protein si:ch211-161h7.5 n=1 Tax=Esox lucius TaxID=8010 RepID=UPI000973248F|nr:uncharacterized protein si:ch211-161h7.5 [Esox lucius]
MGGHDPGRMAVILLSVLLFLVIIVFNALASTGVYPFLESTANVSAMFDTQITPSGWTFSIWGVIYSWLSAMLCYILSGLCRKNAYGWMYCRPSVLPYGFYVSWLLNMVFNVTWLFLWDRALGNTMLMIPAFVILFLVALTNYMMIIYSCHALHTFGAWLDKNHKMDLWLIRVLVQNGLCVYSTWTTIASLINFTIVMNYNADLTAMDAATVSLSILTAEVLVWFILENFVFEKHMRYILTIYPVVILALCGNMTKNYDEAAPSRNAYFTAVLLGVAITLFVVRVCLVVWRHIKEPLYKDQCLAEAVSPMEIAVKKNKLFL